MEIRPVQLCTAVPSGPDLEYSVIDYHHEPSSWTGSKEHTARRVFCDSKRSASEAEGPPELTVVYLPSWQREGKVS